MCPCQISPTVWLWRKLEGSPFADVFLTGDAWGPFSDQAVGQTATKHELCATCSATRVQHLVSARRLTGEEKIQCACCELWIFGPDVLIFGGQIIERDPNAPVVG